MSEAKLSDLVYNTFFRMFKHVDREFYERNQEASKQCGAVVTTCLLLGNMLYCANLGDCRTVLCRNGQAINMSLDHKATLRSEAQRIRA